jgi:hypothetical protein
LPAELAELVARCQQPGPAAKYAGSQLRLAIKAGQVPSELIPTIPGELLAGPEVPASGSG